MRSFKYIPGDCLNGKHLFYRSNLCKFMMFENEI